MNRFTNKNGDILPFQMVKLASGKDFVKAVGDAFKAGRDIIINPGGGKGSRSVTVGKSYLTKQFDTLGDGVKGVGNQVGALSDQVGAGMKSLDDIRGGVKNLLARGQGVTKEELGQFAKVLDYRLRWIGPQLEQAYKAGNTTLINQLKPQLDEILAGQQALAKQFPQYAQQILDGQAALAKKIPGFGKMMMAAGAGSAVTTAGAAGISHLANNYANKAHAAGTDAAKEGELAAQQKGQGNGWWDNTWNDVNKFREENPGLFYGGLGVGLLGGGYALSEMLDDDDDEEDEYSR